MMRASILGVAFLTAAHVATAQTTGSISGTLTLPKFSSFIAPGVGVAQPDIYIFNAAGTRVQIVRPPRPTNSETVQWTASGLAPGTYYVRTVSEFVEPIFDGFTSSGWWVDTLFDRIPCVAADCNPTTGTPVTVVAGQTAGPVNFTLDLGATITGFSSSKNAAEPVRIFDARGVPLPNRGSANYSQQYVAGGLPGGSYYLLQVDSPEMVYPNILCDGCAVTSGIPVTVALGENKTGIDFPVTPGTLLGGISGSIQPSSPGCGGYPFVYSANGAWQAFGVSTGCSTYAVTGLAPGTYFVATASGGGTVVDQLYGVGPCPGCDPTMGTPVTVTAGSSTTGIDLSFSQGAPVSGLVLANDGTRLDNVLLRFYRSVPSSMAARAITSFGFYSVTLPPGSYYVRTDPVAGYAQQIFNGIPCPQGNCPTALAMPVVVGATPVTGINFSLQSCTAPVIAPVTLARAAVGVTYRQTFLATGGSGAVGLSVVTGAVMLPPGLTFDPATGVLSGTPTASGNFTFTIAAIDALACAGTRTYTLDVPPCPFTLTPTSASLGGSGAQTIVSVSNTCGPFTATPNTSWLTVQGVTTTSVTVIAAPNSGGPRQGTVTIGSRVFTVYQSGAVSSPPFGHIDAPANGVVVSGSVAISGWALGEIGVQRVLVYRDPVAGETAQVFVGQATFVSGARPDVEAAYPALPFSNRAGWGYLLLTNMLPNGGNGTFRFWMYAEDADLNRTLLGTRAINVFNSSATAPFGAIDTPGQGATVSGSAFVNFGWALTPQPKMIPFDGSTIRVLVDGAPVGTLAGYNLFRPDVSGLFPGLKNSGGPVGYSVIDTTALSEGLHTIAWLATDDGGVTTGIGSRFFTVNNSAWQPSLRAAPRTASAALTSSGFAEATATAAVPARVDGVDLGRKAASLASLPLDPAGERVVQLASLQGLELSLSDGRSSPDDSCPVRFAGYLEVSGELRPLPVGSSLDPSGTFYWHPGPGYFGTYHLLFVRTACGGAQQRIPVEITIQ